MFSSQKPSDARQNQPEDRPTVLSRRGSHSEAYYQQVSHGLRPRLSQISSVCKMNRPAPSELTETVKPGVGPRRYLSLRRQLRRRVLADPRGYGYNFPVEGVIHQAACRQSLGNQLVLLPIRLCGTATDGRPLALPFFKRHPADGLIAPSRITDEHRKTTVEPRAMSSARSRNTGVGPFKAASCRQNHFPRLCAACKCPRRECVFSQPLG